MNWLQQIFNNRKDPKPAFYFYQDGKTVQAVNYETLWKEASKVAAYIASKPSGTENIIIAFENSPEFLYSFFGVMLAGHVPVPILPRSIQSDEEYKSYLSQIIKSSKANRAIVNVNSESSCNEIKDLKVSVWSKIKMEDCKPITFALNSYDDEDECYLQYTLTEDETYSVVATSFGSVKKSVEQFVIGTEMNSSDKVATAMPLCMDSALLGGLFQTMKCGAEIHIHRQEDVLRNPTQYIHFISDKKISYLIASNKIYKALVDGVMPEQKDGLELMGLRIAMFSSETPSYDVCRRMINYYKQWGLRSDVFIPVFGLAEIGLGSLMHPLGFRLKSIQVDAESLAKGSVQVLEEDQLGISIISTGKIQDLEAVIYNESFDLLDVGKIGKVYIKDGNDYVDTEEVGFIYQSALFILGRIDEVISVAEQKFYPQLIERKISSLHSAPWASLIKSSTLVEINSSRGDKKEIHLTIEVAENKMIPKSEMKEALSLILKDSFSLYIDRVHIVPVGIVPRGLDQKAKRAQLARLLKSGALQSKEKFFYLAAANQSLNKLNSMARLWFCKQEERFYNGVRSFQKEKEWVRVGSDI